MPAKKKSGQITIRSRKDGAKMYYRVMASGTLKRVAKAVALRAKASKGRRKPRCSNKKAGLRRVRTKAGMRTYRVDARGCSRPVKAKSSRRVTKRRPAARKSSSRGPRCPGKYYRKRSANGRYSYFRCMADGKMKRIKKEAWLAACSKKPRSKCGLKRAPVRRKRVVRKRRVKKSRVICRKSKNGSRCYYRVLASGKLKRIAKPTKK
mgnify:CR=1 FL=1|tara:strand:+ start:2947 stop:3567 length:621 start_codon:yes stop_codon:yes gene_type:complete